MSAKSSMYESNGMNVCVPFAMHPEMGALQK